MRIASGLVLFLFAATHFLNHALGLISVETMQEAQRWRWVVTRSTPGTFVLLTALVTHMALALYKVARRATLRLPAWELAQLVLGLIENLQRTDLDPIEEARGLKRLTEEFGLTHDEVAQRIGKHRVSVTQSLRLLAAHLLSDHRFDDVKALYIQPASVGGRRAATLNRILARYGFRAIRKF